MISNFINLQEAYQQVHEIALNIGSSQLKNILNSNPKNDDEAYELLYNIHNFVMAEHHMAEKIQALKKLNQVLKMSDKENPITAQEVSDYIDSFHLET